MKKPIIPSSDFYLSTEERIARGSPFSNKESWKLIFHIFLKIHSEVVAPLKCAAGGEHKWEVEATAGSNFSSVTPWPGQGCVGPRAKWSVKTTRWKGCHFITRSSVRTNCSDSSLHGPLMLLSWRNSWLALQSFKTPNPRLVTSMCHSLQVSVTSRMGAGITLFNLNPS